jgi:hypothetical protein
MTHANDHKLIYCPRWLAIRAGHLLAASYDPQRDRYDLLIWPALHYQTDADLATEFQTELLALLGPADTPASPLITVGPRAYVRADHIRHAGITPDGITFIRLVTAPETQEDLPIPLPLADLIAAVNQTRD